MIMMNFFCLQGFPNLDQGTFRNLLYVYIYIYNTRSIQAWHHQKHLELVSRHIILFIYTIIEHEHLNPHYEKV